MATVSNRIWDFSHYAIIALMAPEHLQSGSFLQWFYGTFWSVLARESDLRDRHYGVTFFEAFEILYDLATVPKITKEILIYAFNS